MEISGRVISIAHTYSGKVAKDFIEILSSFGATG